ncbi:MAG: hypothetical protein HYS36_00035 [Candidatus Rokubacteria bacterium]|nr:hypothetical protein [Candidatus Rokubacteria bacterium]
MNALRRAVLLELVHLDESGRRPALPERVLLPWTSALDRADREIAECRILC